MTPYYQDESCTIYHGDCREILPQLPKVDLVLTSPPYDNLRTYGANFSWSFEDTAKHLTGLLDQGSVICWNVGDQVVNGSESGTSFRQALYFMSLGLRLHDTMIYGKVNGSKPDKTRYNQCFEYIFVLSVDSPKAFNPIRDKPNVTAGMPCFGKWTTRQPDGSMVEREYRKSAAEFGVRSNIWIGKTAGQENVCQSNPHPAMMPNWLANDLIYSWSDPASLVLDPLMGSGTTLVAAKQLGRKVIGIEIEEKYCEIAAKRIRNTVTPLIPIEPPTPNLNDHQPSLL